MPVANLFCHVLKQRSPALRVHIHKAVPRYVFRQPYPPRIANPGVFPPLKHNSSPLGTRSFFTSQRSLQRHYVQRGHRPSGPLQFLDSIPENTVFYTILGLNGLVFVMWYMSSERLKQQRDSSSYRWMHENFVNSWRNLSSGRIWTLATSCFSHENLSHILFNGFTFFFMARPVLSLLGSRKFIFLYMGGGMAANLSSIVWSNIIKGRDQGSLGASAAIYGVVSFLACVAPKLTFHLYGIVPVPAWLVVSGIFAYDTYSALSDRRKGTDTAGHVAGLLAGIGYFIGHRFRIF